MAGVVPAGRLPLSGQELGERCQQHPVRRRIPRTRHAPVPERQPMPEHSDLNCIGVRRWTKGEHAERSV
jgi:hypothetical protein